MKAQGQTLNEDQKISISQKKEVLSGIHELEEVLKGIAGVELEVNIIFFFYFSFFLFSKKFEFALTACKRRKETTKTSPTRGTT